MPGLIDTHTHAPQYVFTGTGMDLPLMEWLARYTFPTEARFADPNFATAVYHKNVVRSAPSLRLWRPLFLSGYR